MRSDQPLSLGAAAKARISLWAYDSTIADQADTLLAVANTSVNALPSAVSMSVPDDAEGRVTPNSGASTRLCYYVSVVIDVDGDGQICPGDLRVDYDRASFRQTCTIDEMEKVFFMKLLAAGEACRPVAFH